MRLRSATHPALLALIGALVLGGCAAQAQPGQGETSASGSPGASSASGASSAKPSSAPTDPRLADFYSQQLSWQGCGGDFQCATLRVPRSYDDPAAGSLNLKLVRLPAADSEARLGSLVINPGGPGGSGIDYARAARAVTSEALRNRYDIVGFDPRGVASSDPIDCLTDPQTEEFVSADASPDSAAERDTLARLSALIGSSCAKQSPDLVAHVGTIEAARDIDILRAVVGDSTLNYLGKSYGTYLGATYADLFPQRVGRMVLDGAIDPSMDATAMSEGQAAGFEQALHRFAAACHEYSDCPLDADPAKGVQQVVDLFHTIDTKALSTDDGRQLTEALAVLGVAGSLYDVQNGWPRLSTALAAALQGNGSELLSIADVYTDREPDGTYASNANDAIYAVNCWDKPATPGVAETEKLAADWAVKYPAFGAYLAWGNLPCATWPGHTTVAPHRVTAPGAPPILVVGTTYDPATPVQWAKALAEQLTSGVFLQWQGDGHTAYYQGSGCIDEKVDAYLLDGIPPANGTLCD